METWGMEKIVLVTGAAGGLGQAITRRLSRDDWFVIVASRSGRRLVDVYGDRHLQIEADCSTSSGAQRLLQVAKAHQRLPTALVHCAGNIRLGALHRMKEDDFLSCLNANLVSAFYTLAAFVGALREQGSAGAAVLVSSAAAQVGTANHEAVAASKAGLEGLVRSAAATYAPAGIRINAVASGILETPATQGLLASPALREIAARQYPLPGIGAVEDLAELMTWLLSAAAARVTGQVWNLDGGFSAIRPLVK